MQRIRVKCVLCAGDTSEEGGYVREIEKIAAELYAVEPDKGWLGENSTNEMGPRKSRNGQENLEAHQDTARGPKDEVKKGQLLRINPDGHLCVTGRRDAEGECEGCEGAGDQGKMRSTTTEGVEYGKRELSYNGRKAVVRSGGTVR